MKIQINQYKLAKTFLLIPIIVTIVIIISLLVANVLEGPTNRGIIYSIFALIGILGIFLLHYYVLLYLPLEQFLQ